MRFEYLVVTNQTIEGLNRLGADGWELIMLNKAPNPETQELQMEFLFKREITQCEIQS